MKQIVQLLSAVILVRIASAGEPAIASPSPEPRFKIYGWIESELLSTPTILTTGKIRLFDDRANEPVLNQAIITL